jgi:hypothetical protein
MTFAEAEAGLNKLRSDISTQREGLARAKSSAAFLFDPPNQGGSEVLFTVSRKASSPEEALKLLKGSYGAQADRLTLADVNALLKYAEDVNIFFSKHCSFT